MLSNIQRTLEAFRARAPAHVVCALGLLGLAACEPAEFEFDFTADSPRVIPRWILNYTEVTLYAVALTEDCSEGWAVGGNGTILRYSGDTWAVDSDASFLTGETLYALWLNDDGSEGWAMGPNAALRYTRKAGWELLEAPRGRAFWIASGGDIGWSVDKFGTSFRLDNGAWSADKNLQKAVAIWMDREGKKGWATTETGTFLEYKGNEWNEVIPSEATGTQIDELMLTPNGELGVAVGSGEAWRFSNSTWKRIDLPNDLSSVVLSDVWISQDGSTAWAVGTGGIFVHFEGEDWEYIESEKHAEEDIESVWISEDGSCRAASGGKSTLLALEGGDWTPTNLSKGHRDDSIEAPPGCITPRKRFTEKAIWCSKKNATDEEKGDITGWAAAGQRGIWRLENGKWDRYPQLDKLFSGEIEEFRIHADERRGGWAKGDFETELLYKPIAIETPILSSGSSQLSGAITFPPSREIRYLDKHEVNLTEPPNIEVPFLPPPEDGPTKGPDNSGLKIRLTSSFLESLRLEGTETRIQTTVYVKDARLSGPAEAHTVRATFESDEFTIKGFSSLQKVALATGAFIFSNASLFFLSLWYRPVRNFMLQVVGYEVKKKRIGSLLLVPDIFLLIKPLRMALFRVYRSNLASDASEWLKEKGEYIATEVVTSEGALTWEEAFTTLSRPLKHRKGKAWLILGDSGLGKTRLLESWTRLALEQGLTPLFVPLGEGGQPQEQAPHQMRSRGDLDLSPSLAEHLLSEGGFLLFLDALNESTHHRETKDFISSFLHRNVVVLTSQVDPNWEHGPKMEKLELREFGPPQLVQLLGSVWAERILASHQLSRAASLPATALLLKKFIAEKGTLPRLTVEIYDHLISRLDVTQVPHLEKAASECFEENRRYLTRNQVAAMEDGFLHQAVENGLLTRRLLHGEQHYWFSHELIRSFFVARDIGMYDEPLPSIADVARAEWKERLWDDFWEFKGELYAGSAIEDPEETPGYLAFLREVVEKGWAAVFAARLYPQYDNLCEDGLIQRDKKFDRWAKKTLEKAPAKRGDS